MRRLQSTDSKKSLSACLVLHLCLLAALLSPCPGSACSFQKQQGPGGPAWVQHVSRRWQQTALGFSGPAAARRSLSARVNTSCVPSDLAPEFDCQLDVGITEVQKQDNRIPPPGGHIIHWSLDDDPVLRPGMRFAVLVHGYPINYSQPYVAANLYPPGWAGLGWSPEYPPTGPPQMINASAVMGWLDSAGQQQVGVYDLWAKSVTSIMPSLDMFTITNTSVVSLPSKTLILRFRRSFDATFNLETEQRMITAHHHVQAGIVWHNMRAAVMGTFGNPGSIRTVAVRLEPGWVLAHAWCMAVSFGILFPIGIVWARYCRDAFRKWFAVHIGVQITGMGIALAGLGIAVVKNRPFDGSLNHYQLGVAVITLMLLQPFSSLPHVMTHHASEMKSVVFQYIHWTVGRACLVLGLLNMFLGLGRYRTYFGMTYWAETTLGVWIAGLIMVCMVFEVRTRQKETNKLQEDIEELGRLLHLHRISSVVPKLVGVDDALFEQVPTRPSKSTQNGSQNGSQRSMQMSSQSLPGPQQSLPAGEEAAPHSADSALSSATSIATPPMEDVFPQVSFKSPFGSFGSSSKALLPVKEGPKEECELGGHNNAA